MAIAGSLMLTPGAALGCGSATEEPTNAYRTLQETTSEQASHEDGAESENAEHERERSSGESSGESGGEGGSGDQGGEKASPERESARKGSGDDALVVVDREYGLPEEYEPGDLVRLSEYSVPTVKGREMRLRDEAAEALSRLIEDANDAGVELMVGSAYRSHEQQVISYENWTAVFGEEDEGGFSAPPGHSEHQLGTVADFTNAAAGYELGQWFGKTRAAEWLRQNAARYGFIMSYPRDSQQQTGYRWEPWHYRYVGPENAARYKEGDYASPRQFLLEEGVRPSDTSDGARDGGSLESYEAVVEDEQPPG